MHEESYPMILLTTNAFSFPSLFLLPSLAQDHDQNFDRIQEDNLLQNLLLVEAFQDQLKQFDFEIQVTKYFLVPIF